MTKKTLIFLICSYLIAFSINFFPSIKYPDSNVTILNLLVTVLFIITLLALVKKVILKIDSNKGLSIFLTLGCLSGLIIYVITIFQLEIVQSATLHMIVSIHYPLYTLFITPLFGLNYLFSVNYGFFSLLASVVYLIGILLIVTSKRIVNQSA